jgi:hypothetical protein
MVAERVYWDSSDMRITSARVIHEGVTYPISAVKEVALYDVPHEATPRQKQLGSRRVLALLALPFFMFYGAAGLAAPETIEYGPASIAISIALIVWVAWMTLQYAREPGPLKQHQVWIAMSHGKQVRVVADPTDANGIAEAINAAIAERESSTGSGQSVAEELEKLAALRGAGVISPEDWERAKSLFLGKEPDERDKAVGRLRKLHELHREGVLSESEFNSKKWDILAKRE